MRSFLLLSGLCLGASALAFGCTTADIDPMEHQPKVLPYRPSAFFADGRAMRPAVPDTVPTEEILEPKALIGALVDGGSQQNPLKVDAELLSLGQKHFNIDCAACHGLLGNGQSVVARKMALRPPPSLLDPLVRTQSDRDVFLVMTLGYGLMPPYRDRLSERERWAVVAYVRALELSQAVSLSELPARDRQQFLPQASP